MLLLNMLSICFRSTCGQTNFLTFGGGWIAEVFQSGSGVRRSFAASLLSRQTGGVNEQRLFRCEWLTCLQEQEGEEEEDEDPLFPHIL